MTKREDNPYAAEFRLQPLERGYGYTLGNSLRRMLLSSLRGAAVWAFRLDGVVHEHQTISGVVEDAVTRKIGDYDYTFPRVRVNNYLLWPPRPEYDPRYYPPPWYYDPWYPGYPYYYPYRYYPRHPVKK